jgi:hypothetical protein
MPVRGPIKVSSRSDPCDGWHALGDPGDAAWSRTAPYPPRVEGLPAAFVPGFPRRTLTVMTGTVQ